MLALKRLLLPLLALRTGLPRRVPNQTQLLPDGMPTRAKPIKKAARRRVYLGHIQRIESMAFTVGERDEVVPIWRHTDLEGYKDGMRMTAWGRQRATPEAEHVVSAYFKSYAMPVVQALSDAGIDGPVLLRPGDNFRTIPVPAVTKSLPLASPGYGMLLPLRADRHFEPAWEVDESDVPFAEKRPEIIWRGNTSGPFQDGTFRPAGPRAFIPGWYARRDPRVDVGFSNINETFRRTKLNPAFKDAVERTRRPRVPMAAQLLYRYILVLEGQDTATGLKWALNSNSVVLMPQPRIVTWATENLLKPFVHYVPVRSDLADLTDVLEWCEANLDAVQVIAENGKVFMAPFRNEEASRALAADVVTELCKRTRFTMPNTS